MSTSKRRRLKAKRTPWAKTRSGRRAHAIANMKRAMVIAQGQASIVAIMHSPRIHGKSTAIANGLIAIHDAAAKVPVYGAKTI